VRRSHWHYEFMKITRGHLNDWFKWWIQRVCDKKNWLNCISFASLRLSSKALSRYTTLAQQWGLRLTSSCLCRIELNPSDMCFREIWILSPLLYSIITDLILRTHVLFVLLLLGARVAQLLSAQPSVLEVPNSIPGDITPLFQLLSFLCSFD